MDTDTWLALLKRHRAIALLRAPTVDLAVAMAEAVADGGFRVIEVAWTSPQPAAVVERLRQSLSADCCIGAGTVLTVAAAKEAIAAGAQFCFSPHVDGELIRLCQHHSLPVIPGALTPTEMMTAWHLGADSVKVFPCVAMGGATYIRHLRGPLPELPLVPCGGITVEAASDYLAAGAIAIGISSSLFPPTLVQNHDWDAIRQRAQSCIDRLKSFRECPF